MRQRYAMQNTQALLGALGGGTRQDAFERETDRLSTLDYRSAQTDAARARAEADRGKLAIDQQMAGNVARRGSADALVQALMLRDPTIDPGTAQAHVRRSQGGPYAQPQYASPDQSKMAGETLAGLFASSLADAPTDGAKMADVMFGAGSSAQRLRAPEIAAEDPVTAAFMLNAGTGKDAPSLYGALPGGLGTFGTLTGGMNINQPLQSSVIGENDAQAASSRAQAGAAGALEAQRRTQTGLLGQTVDSMRGLMIDERTGQARPITNPDGTPIGERKSGVTVNNNVNGRPLPAPALRMQRDELEAIGLASAIDKDLAAIDVQIESGALELGRLKNWESEARNWVGSGLADENSRNYATLNATLRKLQNDSLRLNSGVQTEGDAKRQWDELIANISDPAFVRQRLAEIRAINQRAVAQRQFNIDVIRNNYGAGPLDTQELQGLPAAVGTRPESAMSPEASGAVDPSERPRVQTPEDYEALPSGALFIDPDGNERRKP